MSTETGQQHEPPKVETVKAETRDEGGHTAYAAGGTDFLRHKKGELYYYPLRDFPEQGLHVGRGYELSPPDREASLANVLKTLTALVPPPPTQPPTEPAK